MHRLLCSACSSCRAQAVDSGMVYDWGQSCVSCNTTSTPLTLARNNAPALAVMLNRPVKRGGEDDTKRSKDRYQSAYVWNTNWQERVCSLSAPGTVCPPHLYDLLAHPST